MALRARGWDKLFSHPNDPLATEPTCLHHLSEENAAAVCELASLQADTLYKVPMTPRNNLDQRDLLRFLRATHRPDGGFDVSAASAMLNRTLEWRDDMGVDSVVAGSTAHSILECDAGIVFKHCPMWLLPGMDKCGRPVLYTRADAWNAEALLAVVPMHRFLQYFCWMMESMMALMGDANNKHGHHVEAMSLVVEYGDGVDLGSATRSLMQSFFGLLSKHYPERLGKVLVINAPRLVSFVWGFVESMLTKRTAAKISILGKNYQEQLREVMDMSLLPSSYNGGGSHTLDSDGGPHMRWCPQDPVPQDVFAGLASELPAPPEVEQSEAVAPATPPATPKWQRARAFAVGISPATVQEVRRGTHGKEWIGVDEDQAGDTSPHTPNTKARASSLKELIKARQQRLQTPPSPSKPTAAQALCSRLNAEIASKQQRMIMLKRSIRRSTRESDAQALSDLQAEIAALEAKSERARAKLEK